MTTANVKSNDEVFTAKHIAKLSGNRSRRWAQKMFELGEIQSFMMGRERVCLKSSYHEYLQRLIAREAERLEALAPDDEPRPRWPRAAQSAA